MYEEKEDQSKFVIADLLADNSAFVKKWEGCFKYPKINISASYTGNEYFKCKGLTTRAVISCEIKQKR